MDLNPNSVLEKKELPLNCIQVVIDMYERVKIRLTTLGGDTLDFLIDIGLH